VDDPILSLWVIKLYFRETFICVCRSVRKRGERRYVFFMWEVGYYNSLRDVFAGK